MSAGGRIPGAPALIEVYAERPGIVRYAALLDGPLDGHVVMALSNTIDLRHLACHGRYVEARRAKRDSDVLLFVWQGADQ